MSYIKEFENELMKRLNSSQTGEEVIRWVSERILESYRNGIAAGQKGATVKRKGESRRRGQFGKAA